MCTLAILVEALAPQRPELLFTMATMTLAIEVNST